MKRQYPKPPPAPTKKCIGRDYDGKECCVPVVIDENENELCIGHRLGLRARDEDVWKVKSHYFH